MPSKRVTKHTLKLTNPRNENIKEKVGMAHVKVKMVELGIRGLKTCEVKTKISL